MVIKDNEQKKRELIVSEIDKNMFVEAGAGAGKTTLIKNRIVNQLKKGIRPEEIVAITFTNAATRELRERITDAALNEADRTDLLPEEKDNIKAALETIDQMQISTIHSFCNRILKERSMDAGLPMEMVLVDNSELDKMIEDSFNLWAEGLTKDDWDKICLNRKSRWENINILRQLTKQFINCGVEDDSIIINTQVDTNDVFDEVNQFIEEFKNKLIDCYNKLFSSHFTGITDITEIPDILLYKEMKDIIAYCNKGDYLTVLSKLQSGKINTFNLRSLKKYILEYREDLILKKLAGNSNPDDKKKEKAAIEIAAEIKKLSDELKVIDELSLYISDVNDEIGELFVRYTGLIYNEYVTYAKRARAYFYEHLNPEVLTNDLLIQKTYELLVKSDESRRYFSEKFRCIYVDEFQDTDHVQEAFIRLLAGSGDDRDRLRDGALFVVGDPKQSIYRFRGAEPEVYFKTKAYFSANENTYVFELQDNYRSNSDVIEWVNNQFNKSIRLDKITPGQNYVPMNEVKHLPYINNKTIFGVYQYNSLTAYQGKTKGDEAIEDDAKAVTNLILNLVNGGYTIFDYVNDKQIERPIRFSDFLILCSNKWKMNIYAEHFRNHEIPFSMDSNIVIKDEWYLKTFFRVYNHLINIHDTRNTMAALQGLAALGHKTENAKYILKDLENRTNGMQPGGILSFLEKNWRIFAENQKELDKSIVRGIQARITQMVVTVLSSSDGSAKGIKNAMENYLDNDVEHELSLEEDQNAVRFMNLHKAKGLEGNIVIWTNRRENNEFSTNSLMVDGKLYPSIEMKYEKGNTNIVWCSYDSNPGLVRQAMENYISDRIRLEYVAATRAKQAIIFMDIIKDKSEVLFKDEYDVFQDRSVKDIIDSKDNLPGTKNIKNEMIGIKNITMRESLNQPLFISESPSELEDEKAGKEGKAGSDAPYSSRPVGAVYGTVMHRMLELMVGRLMLSYNKSEYDAVAKELVESCYLQAVNENLTDIPADELDAYKHYLYEEAMEFHRWWKSRELSEIVEEYYTELPFSYFYENEGQQVWRHGFADLVLKLKGGKLEIIDYKSDSDRDYIDEAAFINRIRAKYEPQVRAYKDAVSRMFNVSEDNIVTTIISFSEKDVANGSKVRLRTTEIQ